jgi:RNA polymerase sigma factor (sigma-70 family)
LLSPSYSRPSSRSESNRRSVSVKPHLKRAAPLNRAAPRGHALRAAGSGARPREPIGVVPPVLAALLAATSQEARDAAWAAFVEAYTPLLLHTAYRFGHTYDGAMDRYTYLLDHLYREDFRRLRAFTAPGAGRFSTWLVVVARRLLLDYHRHRYGRTRSSAGHDVEEFRAAAAMRRHLAEMDGDEAALLLIRDGSVPDPEAATHAAERTRAVHAAVGSLEPRDQLLLRLRFDEELAAHEIADVMGFATQFHVYRRLAVVLAKVGKLLPREYLEVGP